MTQPPNGPYSVPYQYPQQMGYGFDPLAQYLGPARRASILMFILGGLGFACGICVGVVALLAPLERLVQNSGIEIPNAAELGMSPEQFLKIVYIIMSVLMMFVALLLIILGAFVRKGGLGACVTAIVVCGIALLLLLVQLIVLLFQLGKANPLESMISFVVNIVMLAVFGLQLLWLLQAARASSSVRMVKAQMQAQQWQYQQQMYSSMQPPYGYPQQQQPPAPPSA